MGCQVARIGLFHKIILSLGPMSLVLQLPVPHSSRTVAEVFLAERYPSRMESRQVPVVPDPWQAALARQSARANGLDPVLPIEEFCATARAPKFFLVHRYLDRCGVAEAARSSRECERVSTRRSYRRYGERGRLGRASIGRGDRGRSGGGHGAGVYREGRAGSAGSDGHVGR